MRLLNKEELIRLHTLMSEKLGTSEGLRDEGLLESALYSVGQSFGGVELYPSPVEKCARLAYNLITNHAFIDGNKRIGVLCMLVLLELNGIRHSLTNEDVISIGMGVARGEMEYSDILLILKEKCEK